MRTIGVLISLAFAASACTHGGTAADWSIAHSPSGASVIATLPSGNVQGELLEVARDGIIVKKPEGQVVLVRFNRISRISANGLGDDYITDGTGLINNSRKYRLISHFPQGMTEEIRSRVLAQAGQSAVMVIE